MNTQIKISEIIELTKRLHEINDLNLSEIEFIDDNNEKIIIDEFVVGEFKYTGLSNCDFITSGFYKEGFNNE